MPYWRQQQAYVDGVLPLTCCSQLVIPVSVILQTVHWRKPEVPETNGGGPPERNGGGGAAAIVRKQEGGKERREAVAAKDATTG